MLNNKTWKWPKLVILLKKKPEKKFILLYNLQIYKCINAY